MTDQEQPALTPREWDVVRLLCSGVTSDSELADALDVSENTAHYFVWQIREKLEVADRSKIIAYMLTSGLITHGDHLQWRGGKDVA